MLTIALPPVCVADEVLVHPDDRNWFAYNPAIGFVGITTNNPRSGAGSLELRKGSGQANAFIRLNVPDYARSVYSNLSAMSFDWFTDPASSYHLPPDIAVRVYPYGDPRTFFLVWDPRVTSAPTGAWQHSEAIGHLAIQKAESATPPINLANIPPGAPIVEIHLRSNYAHGSPWHGFVDNFTLGFQGGQTNTYNFEVWVNHTPIADASATQPMVISAYKDFGNVILDGTRSYDPDGDLLHFTWYETGTSIPLALGVTPAVVLSSGTHSLTLIVDDGSLFATNAVSLQIINAETALTNLSITVKADLPRPEALLANLAAALDALDHSAPVTAIKEMTAFKNEIRTEIASANPALSAALLLAAQRIIDVLTRDSLLRGGASPKPGELDPGFDPGSTTDGAVVNSIVVQSDGKIVVAGNFSQMGGAYRNGVARLNEDGTADLSFMNGRSGVGSQFGFFPLNANPFPNNPAIVNTAVVQPDGKVVIGGAFNLVNGDSVNNLARLNSDGSLDASFRTPAFGTVVSLALQPDGELLVGQQYGAKLLTRLNADGRIDTNFVAGVSNSYGPYSYGDIQHIAVQPDGKILITGDFDRVNGEQLHGGARLNRDGSLDTNFVPGLAYSAFVIQPDSKILEGGARFNPDGSKDTSYHNLYGVADALALLADGRALLAGGNFTFPNFRINPRGFARVNADGTPDMTFQYGVAELDSYGTVNTIVALPDGKALIGGQFSFINGVARWGIARLNADGSLDASFHSGRPALDSRFASVAGVGAVAAQNDGRILIGGANGLAYVDGVVRNGMARLNADGTLDTTFQTTSGVESPDQYGYPQAGSVSAIVLQPDEKILLGGQFNKVNGIPRGNIARLNTDGTVDTGFLTGLSGANDSVFSVALQRDGKVIIGGQFSTINGTSRAGIARLNSDGMVDSDFLNGMQGVHGSVFAVAVQPDGRVLLGGAFNSINGAARSGIARLNSDGSLDADFQHEGLGITNHPYSNELQVNALSLQPDGKVLIGGNFSFVNGVSRSCIARLNSNGSLDTSFQSGMNGAEVGYYDEFYAPDGVFYPGTIHSLALRPNGQIVIGGEFTSVNGYSRNGLARLNSDGSLDNRFLDGMDGLGGGIYGLNGSVNSLLLLPDEKVLVAGSFTTINGTIIPGLARLFGRSPEPMIYLEPANSRPSPGSNATLRTIADGEPRLTYQWRKNGANISGATGSTLNISAVQKAAEGTYSVLVTNRLGLAFSSDAVIRLQHPPIADPTATLPLVISLNGVDATLLLDGSRSYDPDGDPIQYSWYADKQQIAHTSTAVTRFSLGAHLLHLVVDDGMAATTNACIVKVLALTDAVGWLQESAGSDVSRPRSLEATLAAALASIDRSDPISAINQLHAFQNKVQAQVAPLHPRLAQQFIEAAQAMIDDLHGISHDLRAFAVSPFEIDLLWTDIYTNEAGYKIERSVDGTNFTQIAQVLPNTTNYRNAGLFPGHPYFYRVRAFNVSSNFPASNLARCEAPLPACRLSVAQWGPAYPAAQPGAADDLVALAAGESSDTFSRSILALKSDRTITNWGGAPPPTNLSAVVSVAVGGYHSLAVKSDGTVVGWGDDYFGQATPPTNLSGVVSVAAGDFHSLSLRNDGTVVGWGGRLDFYNDYTSAARPPTNLNGVVAIAAGTYHSLALRSDGTVVGWGLNDNGQATPPTNLSTVIAIAAGAYHSLALKEDGSVVGWGSDYNGEASSGTNFNDIVGIAAGAYHSFALRNDGTVIAWGYEQSGQLKPPAELAGVTAILSAGDLNLALSTQPAAPSVASKLLSASAVNVTWSPNSGQSDGFMIERALGDATDERHGLWQPVGSTPAGVTNYIDGTVTINQEYWYRVQSHNACGDSLYSHSVIAKIRHPDYAPYNPNVGIGFSNDVVVGWYYGYPEAEVVGFKVERAPWQNYLRGSWTEVGSVPLVGDEGDYYRFSDTNVVPGARYSYRVRAFNVVGNSPYSYSGTIDLVPPAAPVSLTALLDSTNSVRLSWQYGDVSSAGIAGFKLERAPGLNGAPGSWTEITNSDFSYYGAYTDQLASVESSTYWYRIRDYNWIGDSAYSAPVVVRVLQPIIIAEDDAANYTGSTWTNGAIGGTGFGPWTFINNGFSSQSGHFVFTSANNGNRPSGNIDLSGRSFGLYANNGASSVALRHFNAPLAVGQTFAINFDNGYVDYGGSVGLALQNSSNQSRIEFIADGSTYSYLVRGATNTNSQIYLTQDGLHLEFVLTDADTMTLFIKQPGTDTLLAMFTGISLGGSVGSMIDQVRLYDSNAGAGSPNDVFFNSFAITREPIPGSLVRTTLLNSEVSVPLLLSNLGVVADQFEFDVTGTPDQLIVIESSPDLRNWTPIATNRLGTTALRFHDGIPLSGLRGFYRAHAH